MTITQPIDFEQKKDSLRAPWKAGDFGALARTLGAAEAEAFVSRLKLEPGQLVLDIACGTGGATIPLARRGVTVTGLDMTATLLAEARARAASEGLSIRFDEGFVEELPYADASFDLVTSMFGAMFSQYPEVMVAEVARVLKPGGLFAMANWTDAGFSGRMAKIPGKYMPPQPGGTWPMLWGDPGTVVERLKLGFGPIETSVEKIEWGLDLGPVDASKFFTKSAGPLQLMLGHLDKQGRLGLLGDLEQFWVEENVSTEKGRTVVRTEYLQVLARRR